MCGEARKKATAGLYSNSLVHWARADLCGRTAAAVCPRVTASGCSGGVTATSSSLLQGGTQLGLS